MNKNIEKIINRLGPEAQKFAPAIALFLLANPWLIPMVLLGGISIAALLEMVQKK